jgi:hypothetical protein
MNCGSVGAEDKYASRDVSDGGGVCGVVTSGADTILLISLLSSSILVLNNCIRILHLDVVGQAPVLMKMFARFEIFTALCLTIPQNVIFLHNSVVVKFSTLSYSALV